MLAEINSDKSKLVSYQVDEKDIFIFNDQCLFDSRQATGK